MGTDKIRKRLITGRKRNSYSLVVAFIVIALLASCGINTFQTPVTIVFTKENAPTQVKQTAEVALASETLTRPTGTMEPTFAYWATAQESKFDAQSTQVVETKQAISDLSAQYSQMCGHQLGGVATSPDGNWVASDCRFDGDFLRVFHTRGNQIWDVPYSAIFEFYPEFLGSVRILYWSSDGNYLYFANDSCCADNDATSNGDALYRLNLTSGDWVLLIAGNFNYYSFSPDGKWLIYILNNQAGANNFIYLHLLDLGTGKEEFIEAGKFEQAQVVWKQDGLQFALIAKIGNVYRDNIKFSLVVVKLQNKIPQTIILNTDDGLDITAWSNDDILTINRSSVMEDIGYYVNAFDVVFYDLKINQFVTPTSLP